MNMQKLTQKSIDALQNAQRISIEHGNPQIEQSHLLLALVEQEGALCPSCWPTWA